MIRAIGCALISVACLAAGCSTYIGDFQYQPRPAIAALAAAGSPAPPPPTTQPGQAPGQAGQPPALTVLATVIGVHRADDKLGIPDSVEIRLRIEDSGPESVVFNPQTLELSNGQLVPFGHPIAPQPVGLDPNHTAFVTAYFPFPAAHNLGNTDMASLMLRWQVQIVGQTVGQAVQFTRVYPYYYSPVYAYPTPVYVGVGLGFHGHWR